MNLYSLDIYSGKYKDFLKLLRDPKGLTMVFTPNPEILLRASHDQEFMNILKKATYLTPDAHGLYVGAMMAEGTGYFSALFRVLISKKHLAKHYGELIKGSDLTKDIFEYSENAGKKILMIDNFRIDIPMNDFEKKKKEIQKNLASLLLSAYPKLDVKVFFDGEMSPDAIAHYIEIHKIDYVLSCIGMKEQEKRLVDIFSYLPQDMKVVGLGVGSSVDYLLGLQKRAPMIFQKFGLEWLYRLLLDPRRRWRRIFDAFWVFPHQKFLIDQKK